MDLGPLDHQLHACSNRDLSDGKRLRFDRALDDQPCNTWLREGGSDQDRMGKIRGERGPHRGPRFH